MSTRICSNCFSPSPVEDFITRAGDVSHYCHPCRSAYALSVASRRTPATNERLREMARARVAIWKGSPLDTFPCWGCSEERPQASFSTGDGPRAWSNYCEVCRAEREERTRRESEKVTRIERFVLLARLLAAGEADDDDLAEFNLLYDDYHPRVTS